MKKTSLADIAKALGVSKTLVSLVLNGKGDANGINKDTQRRVLAKSKEMNYQPNRIARGLRMGKSNTLGLIVADISNPFYARICRKVEDTASKLGYNLMICSSDENAEKEAGLISMLIDRLTDGLIISTTLDNQNVIERMQATSYPFVLIDREIPGVDTNFVGVDNYTGALSAVEHLIGLGIDRIGHMTISPAHLSTLKDRTRGYKDALAKHNIPLDESLIEEVPYENLREVIKDSCARLLTGPNPAKGLFVANNNLAVAALEAIHDLGIRIPDDLAFVCFDDISLFRFSNPTISAVAQPIDQMAESSVEMLVNQIKAKDEDKQPKKIILSTSLLLRESSLPKE